MSKGIPDREDLFKFNFVLNFLLAGCVPPFYLFIQCAKKPLIRLVALFASFDAEDIAQAMFAPGHGRRRNPGRHGRKHGHGGGIPDINDVIGEKLRFDDVVDPIAEFPGYRFAFRVLNAYEGVAFTAAILDGFTDIGFEGILGVIKTDHQTCQEFNRMARHASDWVRVGGIGPNPDPINADVLEFSLGFFDNRFGTRCQTSNYSCAVSATAVNTGGGGLSEGRMVLYQNDGTIRGAGAWVTIPPLGQASVSASGSFPAGEDCFWGWQHAGNSVRLDGFSVVAFGEHGWLDWVPSVV